MNMRRAWFIAACFAACSAAPAAAQAPPAAPPAQAPPAAPPAHAFQGPPAQGPQGQQPPPCIVAFVKLRDETEKKGQALRAASERHATAKEACGLFTAFTAMEAKLLKYAADNTVWCGIPQQVVDQIKHGHDQSMQMRGKVCQAAANGGTQMTPHTPTLSDALGAPIPDAGNIKRGGGTFDTLTGTPLGTNK